MEITEEHLNSHNWFDYAEFYNEMAEKDFKVYVELGCWKGHSVCHLAKNIKEGAIVWAVDYWDEGPDTVATSYLPEDSPKLYDIYNRNLELAGVRHMVKDIKGCTWESASLFEDESVDFVFVDGDHSEEGVSRDIEAWWTKLKNTGIMAGHDYNRESVHAAVKKAFNVYDSLGNVWIVNKEYC
jgi:predicted O-methyltransferase YrrM